jgi:hypothetical protein
MVPPTPAMMKEMGPDQQPKYDLAMVFCMIYEKNKNTGTRCIQFSNGVCIIQIGMVGELVHLFAQATYRLWKRIKLFGYIPK